MYGLAPVSESEMWEAFRDLAAELYPGGPDEDGLWERAGGDDADLATHGNGRSRWQERHTKSAKWKRTDSFRAIGQDEGGLPLQ